MVKSKKKSNKIINKKTSKDIKISKGEIYTSTLHCDKNDEVVPHTPSNVDIGLETIPCKIPNSYWETIRIYNTIQSQLSLDVRDNVNTSSYVNTYHEDICNKLILEGMKVNLADRSIYKHSGYLRDTAINMVANLWNCPKDDFNKYGCFTGSDTVGSTEACLLASLALKMRWRKWYCKTFNFSEKEIYCIKPNIVISSLFQACWEKVLRYLDIDGKIIKPKFEEGCLINFDLEKYCDKNTIGVIGILGNHWNGKFDDIHKMDKQLKILNKKNNWQIGIHVDAASGGFCAPFYKKDVKVWDFRLKNVLSISASGHKFGQSCIGTGWIVWRHKKNLSEYIEENITYLGGNFSSYTLNFSKSASGVYAQLFKFLKLGQDGYKALRNNRNYIKNYIINEIKDIKDHRGINVFEILNKSDNMELDVVSAKINNDLIFDSIDFQYSLSEEGWYVSGYKMAFFNPISDKMESLFSDKSKEETMFRIVVKNNMTLSMVKNGLIDSIKKTVERIQNADLNFFKKLKKKYSNRGNQKITQPC